MVENFMINQLMIKSKNMIKLEQLQHQQEQLLLLKKKRGSATTTLIILNEEMNDIMKIAVGFFNKIFKIILNV